MKMRSRWIVGGVILTVAVALAAGCSNTPSATKPTSPNTAHPAVVSGYASCQAVTGGVRCTLPVTDNHLTIAQLLTEAKQASSSVSATTTMVITAIGGAGGGEPTYGTSPRGGYGGKAQTVTTAAAYEASHGTNIYYYAGENGTEQSTRVGNTGGASTLVSWVNLDTAKACIQNIDTCSDTNVLLIAGGGGGSGMKEFCNGGKGGTGGTADATSGNYAAGNGQGGEDGGCTSPGKGGDGGKDGVGGDGGGAGGGATAHDGRPGSTGAGGHGGSVHDGGTPPDWDGVGKLTAVGTDGAGGEGEWRGSSAGAQNGDGGGGGGGGGFGGGGGGGGGGYDYAGGGGGGGGSYAAAATGTAPTPSVTDTSGSAIVITFVAT